MSSTYKSFVNSTKIFIVIIFVFILPLSVFAQATADASKKGQSKEQGENAPVVDDQAVKIFLDKIEVIGRLEKPQAVFIIPGKNPEIDDIRIERSFFNDIFRPVEKKGRFVLKNKNEKTSTRKDIIPW